MFFPKQIEIIEVGPRDGLQNEKHLIATKDKKILISLLSKTGLKRIETASFVLPKVVPQMADAEEISAYSQELGLNFLALTPNRKALKRAIAANVPQIAVFVGASETFNKKNIGQSIAESLKECKLLFSEAKEHNLFIRAYVSMCFSCPYEGSISFEQVNRVVSEFVQLGADEIDIGDTNGKANPRMVFERFSRLKELYPETTFIAHFHDTNGIAYANVIAAIQAGITKFDSSIAGLGGCPFSPGATGNIATEKLVYLLEEMGIATGVDQQSVQDACKFAKKIILS